MLTRASDDFLQCSAACHGSLVGTRRSHDLECVGEPDDASAQTDLVTVQSGGVAGAVVALVMLHGNHGIWAEASGLAAR